MFSSLARPGRIGAFCSRNIPRHHNNNREQRQDMASLSMSTSSQVQLERVSGDTIGGSGTTLVPKVRLVLFPHLLPTVFQNLWDKLRLMSWSTCYFDVTAGRCKQNKAKNEEVVAYMKLSTPLPPASANFQCPRGYEYCTCILALLRLIHSSMYAKRRRNRTSEGGFVKGPSSFAILRAVAFHFRDHLQQHCCSWFVWCNLGQGESHRPN